MTVPTLEKAIESIEILNNIKPGNINDASTFLTELQKSNCAWMIADQLLYMNKDIYSSYFGAQTMRTKIQLHFEELPVESHFSLKESLIKHLLSSKGNASVTVTNQLSLAIADLFCHMVQWQNSLPEIIHVFSQTAEDFYLLLDILKYIPEEFTNKSLRLGVNRKTQIYGQLEQHRLTVVSVLERCVTLQTDTALIATLGCFNAWYILNIFRDSDLRESSLILLVYQVLERPGDASEGLFKAAVQCAADFFVHNVQRTPILTNIYQGRTYLLEHAYRQCETSKPDYCLEYAKIFCEMAAALVPAVLASPNFDCNGGHEDVRTLHLLLMISMTNRECCAYVLDVLIDVTDQEGASTTDESRKQLTPIFEELVTVMTRHCAVSDIKDEQSLSDFRADVFFVMEQIRMFVDVESMFRKLLGHLSQLLTTGGSSNEAEAVLCMISSLVKFVDTDNDDNANWTEQLLTKVILPNISRAQPSFQSVCFTMFGELCRWSSGRPHIMDAMLQAMAVFVLETSFRKEEEEESELLMGALRAALQAVAVFCKRCCSEMMSETVERWRVVEAICARLPQLEFVLVKEMVVLYESVGKCLARSMEKDDSVAMETVVRRLWHLCQLNIEVVNRLYDNNNVVNNKGAGTTDKSLSRRPSNPCLWLDNVAGLFSSMSRLPTTVPNPETRLLSVSALFQQYLWPTICLLIDRYIGDGHVLERVVRLLRYVLRALQRFSKPLLGEVASKIVSCYGQSRESCFIYIGGILVDEFGNDADCGRGLVDMFQALSSSALQDPEALVSDPHTTEDLFRLMVRLVQHCSSLFLSSPHLQLSRLLELALRTLTTVASTTKVEAKLLALRFIVETLECPVNSRTVTWLLQERGLSALLTAVLHLCRWHSEEVLGEDLASDMALGIINCRRLVDQTDFLATLDSALLQLGLSRQDGLLYVTDSQKEQFREHLLQDKFVLRAIEDFTRLFI